MGVQPAVPPIPIDHDHPVLVPDRKSKPMIAIAFALLLYAAPLLTLALAEPVRPQGENETPCSSLVRAWVDPCDSVACRCSMRLCQRLVHRVTSLAKHSSIRETWE